MAATYLDKVTVACPHCGHRQPEPRSAFSTVCKKCGQHYRVQEVLNPPAKAPERIVAQRRVSCFECGAEMDTPASAESTMCKRCGRYVDLHSYRVTTAMAKNFKTKGALVIEPKGRVFNSETVAGDVSIKGQFHGKLTAERSLTIYTGADIKGSLTVARLIIPAENFFRCQNCISARSAEIDGELAADVRINGTLTLRARARMFGDVQAGTLLVEAGAVVVGTVRVGLRSDK